MVKEEYKEAITEVMDILKHTKKEDVDKISPSFMKYLQSNVSTTYIPNLDHTYTIDAIKKRNKSNFSNYI